LADPRDQWHTVATQYDASLEDVLLVTTDEVLVEFATQLGVRDRRLREIAGQWVRAILRDPAIEVIAQSRASFLDGLALYESRPDKLYSLTNCISMATMRSRAISEVLTFDRHFAQEGFRAQTSEGGVRPAQLRRARTMAAFASASASRFLIVSRLS
jgi:predicted nucleic acid-binding protein